MTLEEVQEIMVRAINGLDASLGSRLDPLYIERLIHNCRVEAIRTLYNGSRQQGAMKKVDSAWVQHFEVNLVDGDQDDNYDYLVFDVPPPAQINKNVGGLIYVGSTKKTKAFNICQTRSEISDLINRGYLENGKDIACIHEGETLKVWGNDNLKKIRVSAILQDPTEAPNYLDEDAYPVSADLVNLIRELVLREVSVGLRQAPDVVVDSAETNLSNVTRQNIK
jgi:hypothetical protein